MINKKIKIFLISIMILILSIGILGGIKEVYNTSAIKFLNILDRHNHENLDYEVVEIYKEKIEEDNINEKRLKNIKLNLYTLGIISALQGNNDEALEYLNEAVTYTNNKDFKEIDILIHNEIASNYTYLGDMSKSNEYFQLAEEMALKKRYNEQLSNIYYKRAKVLVNNNINLKEIIDLAKKSLSFTNKPLKKIQCNIFLASLYRVNGVFDVAMEHSIEALDLAIQNNNNTYRNKAVISFGENSYVQNDYNNLIYIYESLLHEGQLKDIENITTVLGYLVEVYGEIGDYDKAEQYMYQYLDIINDLNKVDKVKDLIWIYNKYSKVKINEQNLELAIEYYKKAIQLYEDEKHISKGYMNFDIARIGIELDYLKNKDYRLTLERYEKLLEEMDSIGMRASVYRGIIQEIVEISKENEEYYRAINYIEYIEDNYSYIYNNSYTNSVLEKIEESKYEQQVRVYKFTIIVIGLVATSILGVLIIVNINNKKINKLNNHLKKISITDSLTTAYNKRYLYEVFYNKIEEKAKVSFIMIDIDYFKQYNDNYGHVKGDEVLVRVANVIEEVFSDDDVFRYGGEEFAIISDKSNSEAMECIKKLMDSMKSVNIEHSFSEVSDRITLSVGLETRLIETKEDMENIIKIADEKLYKSKGNGRNTYTY